MPRYIDADRMIKGLPRLCHQVAKSNTCRACPLFDTEDDYIEAQYDAGKLTIKTAEWSREWGKKC